MNAAGNRPLTRALIHETLWNAAARRAEKDPKELAAAHRFLHELGFDSLDVAEFAMEVEEELGITLPDKMFDNVLSTAWVEGVAGQGVTAALVDTGLYLKHPLLARVGDREAFGDLGGVEPRSVREQHGLAVLGSPQQFGDRFGTEMGPKRSRTRWSADVRSGQGIAPVAFQERVHVVPEGAPLLLFDFGQPHEPGLVAQARQPAVDGPVFERLPDRVALLRPWPAVR